MVAVETSNGFEPSVNEKQNAPVEDLLAVQEESLYIVKKLRSSEEWDEVVAYEYLSPSARAHSLTATTLRGPNMMARRPVKFFNKDKTACVMAIHFGQNL